jgi:hypothetical protein
MKALVFTGAFLFFDEDARIRLRRERLPAKQDPALKRRSIEPVPKREPAVRVSFGTGFWRKLLILYEFSICGLSNFLQG